MSSRFAPYIEKVHTSFWFVPSIMILFTLAIATGTIYWDISQTANLKSQELLVYNVDVKAVRPLLGTIAAAMITVTSIAFSLTIVTLTLASSQFGPRLLRNFMLDKGTQLVLGTFISTFLFCIVVFCAISFTEPYNFKPGLTLFFAIAFTCISVCLLVYFIHNVAKSIQADVVIDRVYCELCQAIEKLFPSLPKDDNIEPKQSDALEQLRTFSHDTSLLARDSGYIQLIDRANLLKLAEDTDCVIKLHFSSGDFVVKDATLASVYSHQVIEKNAAVDLMNQYVVLGSTRTPVQDPEFAVHQLVEIALRALSPGINDPYTAMTCIDKLNAALCNLTKKTFPKSTIYAKDELRLIFKELTFTGIANAAINQIREQSESNSAVTLKLLDSLRTLGAQAQSREQNEFVRTQVNMIEQQQTRRSISDKDHASVTRHIEKVIPPDGTDV